MSPKSLQKLAPWKICANKTGSKPLPSLCSILTVDRDGLGVPRGLSWCPAQVWATGGQHLFPFGCGFLTSPILFLKITKPVVHDIAACASHWPASWVSSRSHLTAEGLGQPVTLPSHSSRCWAHPRVSAQMSPPGGSLPDLEFTSVALSLSFPMTSL